MRTNLFVAGALLALLHGAWPQSGEAQILDSQRRVAGPGQTQFQIDFLQPFGGPVIPSFEGWYRNPDGSYELSFGYFNVNTEEVIEIPLGENNFIEPSEFDGVQPTHFMPMPENDRRYYGVFTVRVPPDFGDGDVVWTLRINGREFSVPGRITKTMDEVSAFEFPGRITSAPLVKLSESGSVARGPAGNFETQVTARVGEPIPLPVWVNRVEEFAHEPTSLVVNWFKHQGPGAVSFDVEQSVVSPEEFSPTGQWATRTAQATFTEAGRYIVRVLVHNTPLEWADEDETVFEYHCCWSNAFVTIDVEP